MLRRDPAVGSSTSKVTAFSELMDYYEVRVELQNLNAGLVKLLEHLERQTNLLDH